MSYASAAAKNSQGGGAKPSQEYLEGSHGIAGQTDSSVDVDSSKVNTVPAGTDLHNLETESRENFDKAQAAAEEELSELQKKAQQAKEKAGQEAHKAKKWADEQGLTDEAKKAKKWADEQGITDEAKKAKKTISKKASEVSAQVQEGWGHLSSDPKAWGSVLGAVNVALLGGLGYYAYKERNNNTYKWDRKTVSAISVGVLTLLGVQGYAAAETARKQQGKK